MSTEILSDSDSAQDFGHYIPCHLDSETGSTVDVYVERMSMWEKMEVYLKMISVPLIIVGVTVVGFLLSYFREIIIPVLMALFLFQISKPIVLRLHRPIIPYFSYEEEPLPEENHPLIDSEEGSAVYMLTWLTL